MSDLAIENEAAGRMIEGPLEALENENPALRETLEQMSRTAAALQAWRCSHESLPQPVIVPLAGKPRRLWLGSSVAAAVVFVAATVTVVVITASSRDRAGLAEQLAWTAQAAQAPVADQIVTMTFDGTEKGNQFTGAGAGGTDVSGGAPPEIETFIRQFAFSFRIPQQLPGGWQFERGRPLSETRVRLDYRLQDRLFLVFLTPSAGADMEFRDIEIDSRRIVVGRRGGLNVGFQGGQADLATWNRIADLWVPKKGSGT